MWVSLGFAILHVAEALSPESVKCFIASFQKSEGSFSQVLNIRTVFTVYSGDPIFENPPCLKVHVLPQRRPPILGDETQNCLLRVEG